MIEHERRPRRRGYVVALVALALVQGLVLVPVVEAHQAYCDTSSRTEFIRVIAPTHEVGSANEYVYFPLLAGTPVEGQRETVNDLAIDGFVKDLGCHNVASTYTISGSDGGLDLYKLQGRFYDHMGAERGQTTCAQTVTGSLPIWTQYVVVVTCGGAPHAVDSGFVPYTVEATVSF